MISISSEFSRHSFSASIGNDRNLSNQIFSKKDESLSPRLKKNELDAIEILKSALLRSPPSLQCDPTGFNMGHVVEACITFRPVALPEKIEFAPS